MYYVYILKCANNIFYVGMTSNINRRLMAHLSGNGSVITKKNKPIDLYYIEEKQTYGEAINREKELIKIFKSKTLNLQLPEKFENLFSEIKEYIEINGNDCWYRIRNNTISFQNQFGGIY